MKTESLDALLKRTLQSVIREVAHSVYQGKEKTYIVFNYNTAPAGFADDAPEYDRYLIQVHLFTPLTGNISSLIRRTKTALTAAGFEYPATFDASDENGRHIVFETENIDSVADEDSSDV